MHVYSSHTLYSMQMKRPKNFKPPTTVVNNMDFQKWLAVANKADEIKLENSSEHFYFMTSAKAHENGRTFVSRDLPFFSNEEPNFFISQPENNKGIQCRFAMRGVISEAHYDSGRNMVAMLRGKKRYILSHPSGCTNLAIISDRKHPSYRHSVVDWTDPVQAASAGFKNVQAFDTVVRKGEILYIPSYWFHYMSSVNLSMQCNSRFGGPPKKNGWNHIKKCMDM
jgi:oxalate decarboxylase/phosphoglucose isomerase-like protein (cupin superfamily)